MKLTESVKVLFVMKMHLVGWDKICRPISCSGLGVRLLGFINKASLSKMEWRLIHEKDKLWVQVLLAKTGKAWTSLKKQTGASNLWLGIVDTVNVIAKGYRVLIENGLSTPFLE